MQLVSSPERLSRNPRREPFSPQVYLKTEIGSYELFSLAHHTIYVSATELYDLHINPLNTSDLGVRASCTTMKVNGTTL